MKTKKFLFVASGVAAAVILSLILWPGQPPKFSGEIERIRLGAPATESSALIFIADRKGFFKDYGLEVSIKEYEAGELAFAGMENDEVDIAAATGFVLATRSFHRKDLRGIATIAATNNIELITDRRKGIKSIEGLRGKKIGNLRGSVMEFFLEVFLEDQGVSPDQVRMVYLNPSESYNVLSENYVDAVVTFTPYSSAVREKLGAEALSWPLQEERDYYFVLTGKETFLQNHRSAAERLIRALIEAERFTREHESEAREILRTILRVGSSYVASAWQQNNFQVRLDQDLLVLMEDEAEWFRGKFRLKTPIPNYLDVLDFSILEKVNPGRVSIFH